MYKSILYSIAILMIPLLMACEKEIGYHHSNQSSVLVMNGFLNPDSVWAVSVTQKFFNNGQYERLLRWGCRGESL